MRVEIRCQVPGLGDDQVLGAVPDHLALPDQPSLRVDLEYPAMLGLGDEDVAVGQHLMLAALPSRSEPAAPIFRPT